MLLFVAMMIASPDVASVTRAEDLYYEARYDEALDILGADCDYAEEIENCERVRAMVLFGLGQLLEAEAALTRMIQASPAPALADDFSPKLRAVYEKARNQVSVIDDARLQPINLENNGAAWLLRANFAQGLDIEAATAFIAITPDSDFQEVPLRKSGEDWAGIFDSGVVTKPGSVHYYLQVIFPGGAKAQSGNKLKPYSLDVSVAGVSGDGSESLPDDILNPDEVGAEVSGELPKWAYWAIGGGVGVTVIAVATFAILALTGGDEKGAVQVQIQFEELP